ncbi:hypothetical protein FHG87_016387 [Trinorchestia longiramus]|nr:hypothetical protein FHG87_016387 [Trinorchestia longiramus]
MAYIPRISPDCSAYLQVSYTFRPRSSWFPFRFAGEILFHSIIPLFILLNMSGSLEEKSAESFRISFCLFI